jgi:prefoldin subunit 5
VYKCFEEAQLKMKIYKQEILDGLESSIRANASIAYCSPAIVSEPSINSIDYIEKIKASSANPKQIDLYYIKSVLVSTGWNKNDDVFNPPQTWEARHTPEDKQFNFMHNENDIIGHITGSYVVNREGQVLAQDDSIPDQFDIITEAVIYNSWTNPENRERMNKIIEEIEQGKWFVSMECLFAGFDYAVSDMDGNIQKIVARNEDSAFLTKHLRAYGGTGEYEGYKVGRSLRDISFSGKGLVARPANPRSIILDASKAFSVRETSLIGSTNLGDKNMSDINMVEKQLADVRSELASALEENKAIKAQIEEAKDKEYAETIASLEQSLTAQAEEIKTLEAKLEALNATITDLHSTVSSKDEQIATLEAAMTEMKKTERNRGRKEMLVKAGFEESEAEESLGLYDSLGDEAFESVVAMYKKKMAKYKDKKEEEEMKTKSEEVESVQAQEQEVTPDLLDGLETSEATLVDASDDHDELASTRASVAEWIATNVLNK